MTDTGANSGREARIRAIDALLPQTQCRQCRYAGCRPYAEAIADGDADIDRCPPGGDGTIAALANLLQRPIRPVNPEHGVAKALQTVVRIDETQCIGCTLCIAACPVDAIVGAGKRMHTVLEDECTGCDLCIEPCPVDCIVVIPADPAVQQAWADPGERARLAERNRARHLARQARLRQRQQERQAERDRRRADPRQALIAAAVERARSRRKQPGERSPS